MGLFDFASSLLGGGGSKSKGDSTTTQEPWSGLKPYLTDAYKQAQNLYNTGGQEYYPNATYSPFASQQELAMGLTQGRALQGNPLLQQAQGYVSGQFGQGAPDMNNALGAANFLATGGAYQNPYTMQDVGGSLNNDWQAKNVQADKVRTTNGVGSGVGDSLRGTMQGSYLNANPYLDQTYDNAADAVTRSWNESVMPSINSTFGLAGRTGGGAHQGAVNQASDQLGNELSGLAANIYGGNYQAERDRQLNATNQLGGFQLQGQGLSQNAQLANQSANLQAGGMNQAAQYNQRNLNQNARIQNQNMGLNLANLNQQGNQYNAGNLMSGANALFGYGNAQSGQMNSLAGMAPYLSQADYADFERLMGVGDQVQGQSDKALQDSMNRFNYYQNQPNMNLQQYINNLSGLPGGFSASNTNVDTPNGSAFGNLIGNVAQSLFF